MGRCEPSRCMRTEAMGSSRGEPRPHAALVSQATAQHTFQATTHPAHLLHPLQLTLPICSTRSN